MRIIKLNTIISCLFLASNIIFVGCTSFNLGPVTPGDLIPKIISATNKASSYILDSSITNTYTVYYASKTNVKVTNWLGTKQIKASVREMAMNMTIDGQNVYDGYVDTLGTSGFNIESYYKNGYEYRKVTGSGLSMTNPWTKRPISDIWWNRETQLTYFNEVLSKESQVNILDDEKIEDVDCFVLSIIPAPQVMIDWIISQAQPVGPQFDIMFGGAIPVVRQDAYIDGSIRLWVDKKSYFPVKIEFFADFRGSVDGESILEPAKSYSSSDTLINSRFDGKFEFSNYNEPISIELPQEAYNAKEH